MPADDDAASDPHALGRVWFHPSEIADPAPPSRTRPLRSRSRLAVALAAVLGLAAGAGGTLGVIAVAGGGDATTTSAQVATVAGEPVTTLVREAARSVVTVTAPLAGATGETGETGTVGIGSGVVVGAGRVVTAAHLLAEGPVAVVTAGGQIAPVEVLGTDPETDLALLRIEGADLVPVRLGSGDGLEVGKWVIALGNGPTTRHWVSSGVISGVDVVATLAGGVRGVALLTTDARSDHEVAGGALLDTSGAVVGILTGPGGTAVPVDVVRTVVDQLAAGGRALHGWAGIAGTDAVDRPGGGVRIRAVTAGGPAAGAGLAPGDVVLAVSGRTVADVGDLAATVRRLRPGDPVTLVVVRGSARLELAFTLGASMPTPADWGLVA